MKKVLLNLLLIFSSLFLLHCNPEDDNTPPENLFIQGKNLVDDPSLGNSGNGATCILCHEAPEQERKLANHHYSSIPLLSLANRIAYWDSTTVSLRVATNECIRKYMNGVSLTESGETWSSLNAYLTGVANGLNRPVRRYNYEFFQNIFGIDTLAYRLVYQPIDTLSLNSGTFQRYCGVCHLNGMNNAPDLRNRPNLTVETIAIKTRLSSTDYSVGRMPFFLPSVLPTDTLRTIITYLIYD